MRLEARGNASGDLRRIGQRHASLECWVVASRIERDRSLGRITYKVLNELAAIV
jgi:hypothetical protein